MISLRSARAAWARLAERGEVLRRILHVLPAKLERGDLAGLDESVASDAATHGLLVHIAAATAPAALDPSVASLVASTRRQLGFQAQRVKRSWDLALAALQAAGIDCLPLKGRGLALRLYGDPAQRFCADVELFVRPESLGFALEVLAGAGFRKPDWISLDYYRQAQHHILLTGPAGSAPVELHFALLSGLGRRLDSAEIFARARLSQVGGSTLLTMTPEDELVYLAAHAAVHGFTPLSFLYDLKVLATTPIDLELALARSRSARVFAAVSMALSVAEHWFGLDWAQRWPAERHLSARCAGPLFADPLILSAAHSRHKRLSWPSGFLLTDDLGDAASRLGHNAARVAKRRARRHLGSWVPSSWGD
ncbi:MAG: nucleotidyltransferase family protein [Deltaproteobacteria bacterium]|nr:nucleotidyltransferase family protein [Deltaproteobacteria bacterium]